MNKKVIIIISSFLLGVLVTITIFNSPLLNKKSINRTKIYEKTSLNTSINKIYKATVLIQSYRNDVLKNTGTGFIYKEDSKYGYILTNEHVLIDNTDVKITLYDDRETEALVLGMDEYLDLAVLRIDKKYVDQIASIGDSEKSLLGDTIFSVGSPLGYDYRGSVTQGIISGKDRMVKTKTSDENDYVMRVIQIDASINPGNSGGPLLNINGEVIGIISLKLVDEDVEGMSFAIPIEYAMNHVEELENNKEIAYPTLGIKIADTDEVSKLLSNDISIETEIDYGAVVLSINKNSNIAKTSLRKGDIITKVNGRKIKNKAYLRYELYQYKINDTVLITYLRNGHEKTTRVVLS